MRRVLLCTGLLAFVSCLIACGGAGQQGGGPALATQRDASGKVVTVKPKGETQAGPAKDDFGAPNPTPAPAQVSPEERWAKEVERQRDAKLKELKADVETLDREAQAEAAKLDEIKKKHKAAVNAVITAKRDKEFREQIAEQVKVVAKAEAALAEGKKKLAAGALWEPRIHPLLMREGDFGKLADSSGNSPIFTVLQVIGKAMLVTYEEQTFWIEEAGTRGGVVDGARYSFPGIIECPGTKQYPNAFGQTKTVLVIRVLTAK